MAKVQLPAAAVRRAVRHLRGADAVLARIMAAVGAVTLRLEPNGFRCLARAIVWQQIAGRAAEAIWKRLLGELRPRRLSATNVLELGEARLRAAGLSGRKASYLLDLSERAASGSLRFARLKAMSDEEVVGELVQVKGIGRWTAEMFLIFSLGRPDVLPVDDFGLRTAAMRQWKLPGLPTKAELVALAAPWRPYATVATWYCWRSLGTVPQSG